MMPLMTDEPITAPEAGRLLGVSSDTVGRMIEVGELELWRKLPGPNGDRLLSRAHVEAHPLAVALAKAERDEAGQAKASTP
jgi:excisionase family DNA binding protein